MARFKRRSTINAAKRINSIHFRLNKAMSSSRRFDRQWIPQLKRDLSKAYRDEEVYWKLKSRNQWLLEGD